MVFTLWEIVRSNYGCVSKMFSCHLSLVSFGIVKHLTDFTVEKRAEIWSVFPCISENKLGNSEGGIPRNKEY